MKITLAAGRLILHSTSDINSISSSTINSFDVCDMFIKNNNDKKVAIARYLSNDPFSCLFGSGHIPIIRRLILDMLVE